MAQVKLILREDIDSLGQAGDLVSVKPGYARNFLLPQGKAAIATESRIRELEHHRRTIADRQAKVLKDLAGTRSALEGVRLEVSAHAGNEGKLFGSVTMQQVAQLLGEKGFEVDRRRMSTPEPIKMLGEHDVAVRLHRDLIATVKVVVTADEASALAVDEAEVADDEETPVFGGASDYEEDA